jgi:hypothetical protein
MVTRLEDCGQGIKTRWISAFVFQVVTPHGVVNIRPHRDYNGYPGKKIDDIEIIPDTGARIASVHQDKNSSEVTVIIEEEWK